MNSRIDFVKRRNAGRQLQVSWKERLQKDVGLPKKYCEFTALEKSDRIREEVNQAFQSRVLVNPTEDAEFYECKFSASELVTLPADIIPTSTKLVTIIFLESETVGVLPLPSSVFSQHWKRLIAFQPDGFVVVDKEYHNKLVLQQLICEPAGALDVAVWGPDWVATIRDIASSHSS